MKTYKVTDRSSRPEVFNKIGVLKNFAKFTGKHLCQGLFLIKLQAEAYNFIKKETLAQVFSCEFCEISKNTFFYRTPLVATSVLTKHFQDIKKLTLSYILKLFLNFRKFEPQYFYKLYCFKKSVWFFDDFRGIG